MVDRSQRIVIADTATPGMANLMRLMNLGGHPANLEAVCRTSDGFYMGREAGDIGYNVFIGKPSAPHAGPGQDMMLTHWKSLDRTAQIAVIALAIRPGDGSPIPLERDFGVP